MIQSTPAKPGPFLLEYQRACFQKPRPKSAPRPDSRWHRGRAGMLLDDEFYFKDAAGNIVKSPLNERSAP